MTKSKKGKFEDLTVLDYQELANEFIKETDRGVAILTASYAEEYLGKYLTSFMVDDPTIDSLFSGFGPLDDFFKKIEIAYAFGYIKESSKNDLHLIRRIRNRFAHNFRIKSFNNEKISSLCEKLSTATLSEVKSKNGKLLISGLRLQYIIAVADFVGKAHNDMLKKKKI